MIASGEAVDGDDLGEEMEELEMKLEEDYQLGEDLKEKVSPPAFISFSWVWCFSSLSCCVLVPFSALTLVTFCVSGGKCGAGARVLPC